MRVNRKDKELLWSQKYRPLTVNDCILPEHTKNQLHNIINNKKLTNHLLLANTNPGIGKTTTALALCEELNLDYISLNASLEANIDVLRTQAKEHAVTVSFTGSQKAIIWDEADSIPIKTQEALRAFIEEYSSNCVHIFTANNKNKILPAIRSRCIEIDFSIPTGEKNKLMMAFFKRVCHILDEEKISYEKTVVANLINKSFPDYRNTLDFIRYHSLSGKIESNILANFNNTESITVLINILKEKDFGKMRKWVVDNDHIEPQDIINDLWRECSEYLTGEGIAELVMIFSNYQSKLMTDANLEITITACLTEVMMIDGWKTN